MTKLEMLLEIQEDTTDNFDKATAEVGNWLNYLGKMRTILDLVSDAIKAERELNDEYRQSHGTN